jgi:DNA-binding MarR family transcriptional regulator
MTSLIPLARRVQKAINGLYFELAPGAIPLTQVAVLNALATYGPLRQHQLCAEAAIDRSTMATMLKGMADAGLVRMYRDINDRRSTVVEITAVKGLPALRQARRAIEKVERAVMERLPKSDRLGFLAQMERVSRS